MRTKNLCDHIHKYLPRPPRLDRERPAPLPYFFAKTHVHSTKWRGSLEDPNWFEPEEHFSRTWSSHAQCAPVIVNAVITSMVCQSFPGLVRSVGLHSTLKFAAELRHVDVHKGISSVATSDRLDGCSAGPQEPSLRNTVTALPCAESQLVFDALLYPMLLQRTKNRMCE